MTRRGVIVASFVGLAAAAAETVLLPNTLSHTVNTAGVSLVTVILGLLAAGIAGRVLLGTKSVHRYFRAGVPVLAAISGLAFESAFSNWLISQYVEFGRPPSSVRTAVIVALVVGAVAYLLAATVYGFAGTRQGVTVGGRIGLLLLLLLAVLPVLNVIGLVGFVLTAFLRRQISPAPAPASA